MAVSLAISIGIFALCCPCLRAILCSSLYADFKDKNTAFNNGYIKAEDDKEVLELLNSDERIENVYCQYKINDVTLSIGRQNETMVEKYPMPKATENMSYGTMPKTVGK